MTAFIHENMEFVIPSIFRATMKNWADDLIQNGTVYFTNIQKFLDDSDSQRGDKNEGRSILIRSDAHCTIEYTMPIYVFCCTLETSPIRVIETWSNRDCVIQITDTLKFAERIRSAVIQQRIKVLPLQLGPVAYTKTKGGHESNDWADGLFQKDDRYDGQKEFRFVLAGSTGDKAEDCIILNLGSCSDIVRFSLILYS